MPDLIVTWPKTRSLASYIEELGKARGLTINYRIARPPKQALLVGKNLRLYRVHDGAVRGWTPIHGTQWQPAGRVLDPVRGSFWPEGHYLVCRPEWHELRHPLPMPGFRGWRWFNREDANG